MVELVEGFEGFEEFEGVEGLGLKRVKACQSELKLLQACNPCVKPNLCMVTVYELQAWQMNSSCRKSCTRVA